MNSVEIIPVTGLPEIQEGDALAPMILEAIEASGAKIRDRDILVLAQKIVSKAEGRLLDLNSVEPSREALDIANRDGRDPRLVEAVLRESNEIVVASERALIVEHRTGRCAPTQASTARTSRGVRIGSCCCPAMPISPPGNYMKR